MGLSKIFNIKSMTLLVVTALATQTVVPFPALARVAFVLPPPGVMIAPSAAGQPAIMMGVIVDPAEPFTFDFLVSRGDDRLPDAELEWESQRLIKYFLAALTVPEEEMWVNLSPDEPDRIIPSNFGYTEMGRDLLAQDYLLKQMAASLIHPDEEAGNRFWERIRERIHREVGINDFPVGLLNRVWIVPEKAVVFERDHSAFVVSQRLRVLTDEEYLRSASAVDVSSSHEAPVHRETARFREMSEVVRDIVIPELEREINEGESFANLRQIFNSLILATWYKKALRETLLSKIYVDQRKVKGVGYRASVAHQGNVAETDIVEEGSIDDTGMIYARYLEAFQRGVFDFIQDDYDPVRQQIIPRRYFSGGVTTAGLSDEAMVVVTDRQIAAGADRAMVRAVRGFGDQLANLAERGDLAMVTARVNNSDRAMVGDSSSIPQAIFGQMEQYVRARHNVVTAGNLERGNLWDSGALQVASDVLVQLIGEDQTRAALLGLAEKVHKGEFDGNPWVNPIAGFLRRFDEFGADFFRTIIRDYPFLTDIDGHAQGRHFEIARQKLLELTPFSELFSLRPKPLRDNVEGLVRRHLLELVILQNTRPLAKKRFHVLLLSSFHASFSLADNANSHFVYGIPLFDRTLALSHTIAQRFNFDLVVAHEIGHRKFLLPGGIIDEFYADLTRMYLASMVYDRFEGTNVIDELERVILEHGIDFDRTIDLVPILWAGSGIHLAARYQLLDIVEALGSELDFRALFMAAGRIHDLFVLDALPRGVKNELNAHHTDLRMSSVEFTKLLLIEYLRELGYAITPRQQSRLMNFVSESGKRNRIIVVDPLTGEWVISKLSEYPEDLYIRETFSRRNIRDFLLEVKHLGIVSSMDDGDRAMSSPDVWNDVRQQIAALLEEFQREVQRVSLAAQRVSLAAQRSPFSWERDTINDIKSLERLITEVTLYYAFITSGSLQENKNNLVDTLRGILNKRIAEAVRDSSGDIVVHNMKQGDIALLSRAWENFRTLSLQSGYPQEEWSPEYQIQNMMENRYLTGLVQSFLGYREEVLSFLFRTQSSMYDYYLNATGQNAVDLIELANRFNLDIRMNPTMPSSQSSGDSAMVVDRDSPTRREVGGIDLNPERMDLEIRRDASGQPLSEADMVLDPEHVEGFYPVIIRITPVFHPLPLLGMGESPERGVERASRG
jgi:hypothetical protein